MKKLLLGLLISASFGLNASDHFVDKDGYSRSRYVTPIKLFELKNKTRLLDTLENKIKPIEALIRKCDQSIVGREVIYTKKKSGVPSIDFFANSAASGEMTHADSVFNDLMHEQHDLLRNDLYSAIKNNSYSTSKSHKQHCSDILSEIRKMIAKRMIAEERKQRK